MKYIKQRNVIVPMN